MMLSLLLNILNDNFYYYSAFMIGIRGGIRYMITQTLGMDFLLSAETNFTGYNLSLKIGFTYTIN